LKSNEIPSTGCPDTGYSLIRIIDYATISKVSSNSALLTHLSFILVNHSLRPSLFPDPHCPRRENETKKAAQVYPGGFSSHSHYVKKNAWY
jgi:hypothetical protein